MSTYSYLSEDEGHLSSCHDRWMKRRNRKGKQGEFNEKWEFEQCFRCTYFLPVSGILGSDWGGCSNEKSLFDGRLMFEHDGCEEFELRGSD